MAETKDVLTVVDEQPTITQELVAQQNTALDTRQRSYLQQVGEIPSGYQQWLDKLPDQVRVRVRNHVNRIKHGLHAVAPLTCTGPGNCPFLGACPIPSYGPGGELFPGPDTHYPIGEQCILEAEFMIQKVGEYFLHLDVDPLNPIESSVVQELALLDLQKNRALLILSHGDKEGQGRDFMHVDESIIGLTEQGAELTSKTTKIHPVLEYIDRIERRREKWLDRLMETRKAKADWAAKMGHSDKDSQLLDEIKQMREVVNKMFMNTANQPLALDLDDGIGLDEEL